MFNFCRTCSRGPPSRPSTFPQSRRSTRTTRRSWALTTSNEQHPHQLPFTGRLALGEVVRENGRQLLEDLLRRPPAPRKTCSYTTTTTSTLMTAAVVTCSSSTTRPWMSKEGGNKVYIIFAYF